ncbi:MAG TPA: winged helix-turn-helix transcriptional regulator [archaeon]|nr:winged helix-turn-helix transcriptional regulator [archaeon]
MIQKILPNSEAKIKILEAIFRNPGINFSALVKESGTSPNIVINYINELVKNGVLKEKRLGGKKKTHIRLLYPNFSGMGLDVFSLVEIDKKNNFLKKYKKLNPIVTQIEDLISSSGIKFCLVYGSFARFSAEKESDIDMWLVGKIDAKAKSGLREIFSTLDREYNLTIESEKDFIKKIGDPIHQNIIKDHVMLYGERYFLKSIFQA